MEKNNNWATPSMKEFLFWREGMTPDEFEIEYNYYYSNIAAVKSGNYVPMWKQKEK